MSAQVDHSSALPCPAGSEDLRRQLVDAGLCTRLEHRAARLAVQALQRLLNELTEEAPDGVPLPLLVLECFVAAEARLISLQRRGSPH